jgi:hypothetical protein
MPGRFLTTKSTTEGLESLPRATEARGHRGYVFQSESSYSPFQHREWSFCGSAIPKLGLVVKPTKKATRPIVEARERGRLNARRTLCVL